MRMVLTPGCAAALSLFLLSAAFAQQAPVQPQVQLQVPPPTQPQSPGVLTLHASSRAVLVDVVVTDKHGKAIHGLKPENFQLLEDGQLQTIASMEEHHAPSATELASIPAPPPLGPNTFTNAKSGSHTGDGTAVVFLLDGLNSPLTAQSYVRDQLMSYFKSMTPGTQVAIFKLDTQLRLLQGLYLGRRHAARGHQGSRQDSGQRAAQRSRLRRAGHAHGFARFRAADHRQVSRHLARPQESGLVYRPHPARRLRRRPGHGRRAARQREFLLRLHEGYRIVGARPGFGLSHRRERPTDRPGIQRRQRTCSVA